MLRTQHEVGERVAETEQGNSEKAGDDLLPQSYYELEHQSATQLAADLYATGGGYSASPSYIVLVVVGVVVVPVVMVVVAVLIRTSMSP